MERQKEKRGKEEEKTSNGRNNNINQQDYEQAKKCPEGKWAREGKSIQKLSHNSIPWGFKFRGKMSAHKHPHNKEDSIEERFTCQHFLKVPPSLHTGSTSHGTTRASALYKVIS